MIPSALRRLSIKPLLAFLAYLGFFLWMFPEVMFKGASFMRRDILRYYYPVWHYSWENLRHLNIPLWNPLLNMGCPHLANPQTCVFYPLGILFLLPDYTWAFNFYILLHLSLSAFFTFLWMRDCGQSHKAAFLAGFAFAAGGYMQSNINLTISLCTATYFPLVLLMLRRAMSRDGFAWKVSLAFAFLFQYLAGDPSIFFASVMVCSIFVLFRTAERRFEEKTLSWRPLAALGQSLVLFLALAAFQWPLFVEFIFHSTRSGMSFQDSSVWSMQYKDLLSVVVPFFSDITLQMVDYWVRQSWLENYYAGATVVVLAMTTFFVRRSRMVSYHALLLLFALSLSLGGNTLVYPVLYKIVPFMNFIRYPVRFYFLFNFSLACLAGFALDVILQSTANRSRASDRRGLRWLVFVALFLALSGAVLLVFAPSFEDRIWHWIKDRYENTVKPFYSGEILQDLTIVTLRNIRRSIFLSAFVFLGIAAAARFRIKTGLLAVFFLVLVFIDLTASNIAEPTVSRAAIEKTLPVIQRVTQDKEVFRVLASPKAVWQQDHLLSTTLDRWYEEQQERMVTNMMLLFALQDVRGYDSLYIREAFDIQSVLAFFKTPNSPLVRFLNVRYMVSPLQQLPTPYRLLVQSSVNLFINDRSLPRALVVPDAETVSDEKKLRDKLLSASFNPTKIVYLTKKSDGIFYGDPSDHPDRAQASITEYTAQNLRMTVSAVSNSWLVVSDVFYPGWKAWVDGKPAKIYQANHAFRAVPLVPGLHEVRMVYDPLLFKIGGTISLFTILGLFAYCVFTRVTLKWSR